MSVGSLPALTLRLRRGPCRRPAGPCRSRPSRLAVLECQRHPRLAHRRPAPFAAPGGGVHRTSRRTPRRPGHVVWGPSRGQEMTPAAVGGSAEGELRWYLGGSVRYLAVDPGTSGHLSKFQDDAWFDGMRADLVDSITAASWWELVVTGRALPGGTGVAANANHAA